MEEQELQTPLKKVTIYTDGACLNNPGPGGWGAVIICPEGSHREISGRGEEQTTNNRMEITAVIEALKALKEPCEVTIYSDSTLVVRGMNEWIEGWSTKGWKTAKKKPVLNKHLWEELLEAQRGHRVSYVWVKGHAGDLMNERADSLANEAIVEMEGALI